jgi:hypothetical protein
MLKMKWARDAGDDGRGDRLRIYAEVDMQALAAVPLTALDRAILRDADRAGATPSDRILALETLARLAWGQQYPSPVAAATPR